MSSFPTHAIWLIIAIAAFAIGKTQFSNDDNNNSSSANNNSTSTKSERALSPANGSGGSASSIRESGDKSASGDTFSPSQMKEAVTKVLSITDPIERQKRFTELLASLTAENAQAAVQALRDAPRSRWSWGQEYSLLTYAWGRLDGPAALAYADELDGRTKEWTVGTVLSGWASEHPEAARTWVEGIADDEDRARATRGLISGLAQHDVNAATDYVYALEKAGTPRTNEFMDSIVRQQLSQGMNFATDWTESLPDGDLKGTAMERVADEYVRKDPALAAEWVAQFAADDYAKEAIGEVSEEWAEDDPTAALEWAEGLEAGESQNRAIAEVVSEWANDDAVAAGDYVAALPAGDQRDDAAAAYARRISEENPVDAIDWALSIAGEELRNDTVARTVRQWKRQDPATATEWIDSAGLPDSVITEINRPPDRRSGWDRRR